MPQPPTSLEHPTVPAAVLAARQRAELVFDEVEVDDALDRLADRLRPELECADPWVFTVMTGGLPAAAALLARFDFPLRVGYLHVGRYGGATRGGELRWHSRPDYDVRGRVVLLVDDIVDRGDTLAGLVRWARDAGAARVLTAVLADREVDEPRAVSADYAALRCPDRYLFGCGMDFQGYWRNLRAIYALPPDLEQAHSAGQQEDSSAAR